MADTDTDGAHASRGGYVGRFAPSPTGPLHFGSLLAATGSYLRARQAGGRWLVRIEDIDPPREVAGAAADILRTLDAFGFEWDGEVSYQSRRLERYRAAIAQLGDEVYACACSRRQITVDSRAAGLTSGQYPGTCANRRLTPGDRRALRLRYRQPPAFDDLLQGPQAAFNDGDFVLWRRDGLPAYQLAVTVDDIADGISEVVRGADLLECTPKQLYLGRLLGAPAIKFAHLPIVLGADGQKLSKQTGAQALDSRRPEEMLCAALAALGAPPPSSMLRDDKAQIWSWAIRYWTYKPLISIKSVALPSIG